MPINRSTAFVSYCREDLDFVGRLATDLKKAGAKVWMDRFDVRPGQRWEAAVEEAVINCSRMLVVLSPASVNSKNVMAEVAFALDEHKELMPVLYRDCKIPFRLRPIQYVDFRKEQDYSSALEELLRTLDVGTAQQSVSAPRAGEEPLQSIERKSKEAGRQRRTKTFVKLPFWAKALTGICTLGALSLALYWPSSQWNSKHKAQSEAGIALPITNQSGWAVGFNGTILHTDNGGVSWNRQRSGTTAELTSVAFPSALSGWAVGEMGTVLHSVDSGGSWRQQASGTKKYLSSVTFANPQSGWAVGDDGTVLHTSNGGATWQPQRSGIKEGLSFVFFSSSRLGWAVGWRGTILHTEDGGAIWKPQSSGIKQNLFSVAFATQQSGWVVGSNGTILQTDDAGVIWKNQSSATKESLTSVIAMQVLPTFRTTTGKTVGLLLQPIIASLFVWHVASQPGWAVGLGGIILHAQSGDDWNSQDSGTKEALDCVAFVNSQIGWVVGDHGTIIHTENGGITWKPQTSGTKERLHSINFAPPQ